MYNLLVVENVMYGLVEGSMKSKWYIDFQHKPKKIMSFWCKSHLNDASSKHVEIML